MKTNNPDTWREAGAYALIVALVWAVIVILAAGICAALAHDHGHPENNEWMRQVYSGRGPCCDGSDSVRVDDPDWEINVDGKRADGSQCIRTTMSGWQEEHGRYCVRIKVHPYDQSNNETAWFFVSDQAVVPPEQNKDGVVRVWPLTGSPGGGRMVVLGVRCFMPGAGI
jgi:hypothetical protein